MNTLNLEINDLIAHPSALQRSDHLTLTLDEPTHDLPLYPSFTLVGNIISHRSISKSSIKSNILKAWQHLKPLTTEDKEDNKMVFTFKDKDDLSRILNNSPWNIKSTATLTPFTETFPNATLVPSPRNISQPRF